MSPRRVPRAIGPLTLPRQSLYQQRMTAGPGGLLNGERIVRAAAEGGLEKPQDLKGFNSYDKERIRKMARDWK